MLYNQCPYSLINHRSCLFYVLETALQDLKKDPKLKQEYREAKKLLNEVCLVWYEFEFSLSRKTYSLSMMCYVKCALYSTRLSQQTKASYIVSFKVTLFGKNCYFFVSSRTNFYNSQLFCCFQHLGPNKVQRSSGGFVETDDHRPRTLRIRTRRPNEREECT